MTSRPARARTPGWLISWAALVFGLGASVAANVAAARPELGPRLLASGAPVLALFAAGIIERVSLTGTHWLQRTAIVGGLLVVVAFAFITSYQHQQLLALEYGNKPLSAALYPIAVDALVLMSSVALAVIGSQRRAARAVWETQRPVPVAAPVSVPVAPPAVVERVDPLGLDGRADLVDEPADPGTPEPVPAPTRGQQRRLWSDQQIIAVLQYADDVPRGTDGKVAIEYVQREFGIGQERAVKVLKLAGLHRAKEGEPVPGDVDEDVPADEEMEAVPA